MKKSLWANKIHKISIKESQSEPFINQCISNMNFFVSSQVNTIAMLNQQILLNPSFISGLSNKEIISLVKHEVYHHIVNS